MVLHGGSGTGDDNLQKAVQIGIQKVNLCTDLSDAGLKKVGPYMGFDYENQEIDPSKGEFGNPSAHMFKLPDVMGDGYKEKLMFYMKLFGGEGKVK